MSHVIIVSNRLPVSVKKEDGKLVFSASLGGLATGLASYVKDGKSVWVGWPGIAREELTEADMEHITLELSKQQCAPVFLSRKQIDNFYNGYSNSLLWPVFHNLPVEEEIIPPQWWKTYREVNHLFAETTLGLAQPESAIWVHDYQLMMLPEMLRIEHTSGHIGFFLHIPFPDVAAWKSIKESRQLIRGVLGADLVGFHTTGYGTNFIQNCEAMGLDAADNYLYYADRRVHVSNFPIGVDYQKYATAGKLRAVRSASKEFKKKYGDRKIIVAVDRLEPSKGLIERMEAYELLLASNSKLHDKVVMVMVAAPSRMDLAVYKQLKLLLLQKAAQINGTYGTDTWQPLDLKIEPLPFEQVNALYRVADVAFIAPLRDGMNLVAKEYVASKHKAGVLVLSETAGAAEELREALLVNPLLPASVAEALQQALSMPKKELRSRLKSMQKTTASNTIHTWASGFVKTLQKPVPGTRPITRTLKNRLLQTMTADYKTAERRLFLLDYDGSLVALHEDYAAAKPTKKMLDTLQTLQSDPRNDVVVVSGRTRDDLDEWVGGIPVNLVAEHGSAIKKIGGKWQSQTTRETQWKRKVMPILERYTLLTPDATIENKPHSLVWHYRSSPSYYAQKYAVIIKKVLKPLLKTYGIAIFQGNKILEIKDPRISKGVAIQYWLRKRYDFVFILGDDFTDEDMFRVAPEIAYSIKVGRGRTYARYRVANVPEVQSILTRLVRPSRALSGKTDKRGFRVRLPAISR
ncbi:MAG: bifunctional alpha,alpha-trehalose-phosphate synthase (UDP-forming)/trehalose-phosphatase [Patescibacteria group bacterium]|nr:bifunctional alpha,alpha-trehalose-phosphate synthase (UDP-forming)/trehalose-phosphatase [Patescibacteria group bacterium]